MKYIALKGKLGAGLSFTVDDEDYEYLNQFNWVFKKTKRGRGQIQASISPHRLIMKPSASNIVVDHIDCNILNNNKSNLRLCKQAENTRNRGKAKGVNTSIYKGVKKSGGAGWHASIGINSRQTYIGAFETEIEAAQAYNVSASFFYKEFANLNLVPLPTDDFTQFILAKVQERIRMYSSKLRTKNRISNLGRNTNFTGIFFHKESNKWYTRLNVRKKPVFVGAFDTEIDAAVAYNLALDFFKIDSNFRNKLDHSLDDRLVKKLENTLSAKC